MENEDLLNQLVNGVLAARNVFQELGIRHGNIRSGNIFIEHSGPS
jgi:hypothetical protein